MLNSTQTPVMDVLPWPQGHGFTGSGEWWDYMMSKDERQRLDNLMGLALLDTDVCDRLLNKRDESLMSAFGLSAETRSRLAKIQVSSLAEFAAAIVSR